MFCDKKSRMDEPIDEKNFLMKSMESICAWSRVKISGGTSVRWANSWLNLWVLNSWRRKKNFSFSPKRSDVIRITICSASLQKISQLMNHEYFYEFAGSSWKSKPFVKIYMYGGVLNLNFFKGCHVVYTNRVELNLASFFIKRT